MTKKEAFFVKRWENTRKMGLLKFSMIYGGLWGFSVGIFSYLMNKFIFEEQDVKLWGKTLFFMLSGVCFYGPLLWWWSNRKYRKILKKTDDEI